MENIIFRGWVKNKEKGKKTYKECQRERIRIREDGVKVVKGEERFKNNGMVNIVKGCLRYIY